MSHSSGRHRRHAHQLRNRSNDKLKRIRYSYGIFVILLLIFLCNVFLHPNKNFLIVEIALTGLVGLYSLQHVVANSGKIKGKELTVYLVTYAIVFMGIIFYLVADKLTVSTVLQVTGIEE